MSEIKTFRADGQLEYDDLDNNFDNLNFDKLERLVSVNDSQPAIEISQLGSGKSLVINTDDVVVTSAGKIGLGTTTPLVTLDINSTDAINIPTGTTAERPASPVEGDFRFNKTTKTAEVFDGKFWSKVNNNLNIEKITSGGYNGIQLFGEGEIYFASGNNNSWNVLTNGLTNNYVFRYGLDNFSRIIIPGVSPVIDSGSVGHNECSYALCQNGDLYVWGANSTGSCGIGSTSVVPQPTLAASGVVKVYTDPSNGGYGTSNSRMVILKNDGYLYGAGYNGYGAFGLGTTSNVTTFTQLVNFGTNIKNVWNLGSTYGCLVVQKINNNILIAGSNINGYFGNGTTTATGTGSPTNITSFWLPDSTYELKYVSGAFGYYDSAASTPCSLLFFAENSSGQQILRTCGHNGYGQIGNGTTANISSPYNMPLTKTIKQVLYTGGIATGYIVNTDGTLYIWGFNGYGQVGNGTTTSVLSPTLISTNVNYIPLSGFNSNVYGYYTTSFIVKNDGSLWAAGYNAHGQCCIGTSTTSNQIFTKCLIPVYQGNTIKFMGMYSTTGSGSIFVAIREDNEIFGWGYNGHFGVDVNITGTNYLAAHNFKIKRT